MVINFFVKMKVNCNKVIYDVENGLRSIHIFKQSFGNKNSPTFANDELYLCLSKA